MGGQETPRRTRTAVTMFSRRLVSWKSKPGPDRSIHLFRAGFDRFGRAELGLNEVFRVLLLVREEIEAPKPPLKGVRHVALLLFFCFPHTTIATNEDRGSADGRTRPYPTVVYFCSRSRPKPLPTPSNPHSSHPDNYKYTAPLPRTTPNPSTQPIKTRPSSPSSVRPWPPSPAPRRSGGSASRTRPCRRPA